MSHNSDATATRTDGTQTQVCGSVAISASTKDAGRVKVGGSSIRYTDGRASTRDAGRVKVGGSSIRYTDARAGTRDAGRVKVGGSSIRF